MTAALIIYTATRSYDLIASTMPEGQQIAGFFALAALDGGLLAWLFWTTRSAAPGAQRTIGNLMVVVCLTGIAAAVLGDTLVNYDPSTKGSIGLTAVWVTGFIIVANIAGTISAELVNPEQQMRDADRAIISEIRRQKAEHLISNAPTIARGVAEAEAIHHAEQMVAGFRSAFAGNGNGAKKTFSADAPAVLAREAPSEEAIAQAQAVIEAAGGKVVRPKRP